MNTKNISKIVNINNLNNIYDLIKNSYLTNRSFPLSYAQLLIWLINTVENKSKNEITGYYLWGDINIDKIERCYNDIVNNNEILQYQFSKYMPVARRSINAKREIFFQDISDLSESDKNYILEKKLKSIENMDLRTKYTHHMCVFKISVYKYIIFIAFSHLVIDAVSKKLFWRELVNRYLDNQIDNSFINYSDYIAAERSYHNTHIKKYQEILTKKYDTIPIPIVGHEYLDNSVNIVKPRKYYNLDKKLVVHLKSVAKQNKMTLENLLTGIFMRSLSKLLANDSMYIFNNNINFFPELYNSTFGPHLQDNIIYLENLKESNILQIAQCVRDEIWQDQFRFLPYCYASGQILNSNLTELRKMDSVLMSISTLLTSMFSKKLHIPNEIMSAYRGLMKLEHYNHIHADKLMITIFNFRYGIGVDVQADINANSDLYAWQPYQQAYFSSNYYICVNFDDGIDGSIDFHFEAPLLAQVIDHLSQECIAEIRGL